MKRFLMTITLSCVLSGSALAGDIPSVGFNAPPPDETTQTTSATSPGDIPSVPGEEATGSFAQQVSDAALSGLLTMLGLLVV